MALFTAGKVFENLSRACETRAWKNSLPMESPGKSTPKGFPNAPFLAHLLPVYFSGNLPMTNQAGG
jgi:hypothetical protein